jgi:hypothetical protein
VVGRTRSVEKSNYLIGIRTRDPLAFIIVPHPTTLPHASVRRKIIAEDLVIRLGGSQVFSTQFCLGPSCSVHVFNDSDIKEHLTNKTKNPVALVRERTIPTERLPLVGEVSASIASGR